MSRTPKTAATVMALALVVAACSSGTSGESPQVISLLAHDSFAGGATDATFASFTEETGIEVKVIAAGDAGSMVNQAILTKDNPLADVLFGVDDAFLSRAIDEDIFLSHKAVDINKVAPALVDREHRVTPIDFGDVCINYDKGWFESTRLVVP
ncbi:MAG: thiamine ABC transporter substrate-binding protein, partial [Acidimicrobiia bacterium]